MLATGPEQFNKMLLFRVVTIILVFMQAGGKCDSSGCNCGVRKEAKSPGVRIEPKISGGKEASVNEFPWAALLEIRRGNVLERCGGTLINDRFVLTAAHCVPKPTGIDVTVILGEHSIRNKLESRLLRIKAQPPFIVHEQFEINIRAGYVIYDFALLRLFKQVNFNLYPHIRPICLPDSSYEDYQGELATVTGWGYTKVDFAISGDLINGIDSSFADTLKKIDIRLYKQKKCEDVFQLLNVQIMDSNVCAASQDGDACGGDSGGGLVRKSSRGGYYEIAGVVSYGIGCRSSFKGETLPGVYARVSSVMGWIEKKTSIGTSCRKPGPTQQRTERPVQNSSRKPTEISTERKSIQQPSSGWGAWTSYSKCDTSCGIGMKTRERFCQGSSCTRSQQTQERPCFVGC
eukprot:GFUD01100054.1.p1 GENE.GFUD01100054.1~~GFUD01100054.1.p1  ORF type:complete len:403 (+),score=68.03 GFUD01100054.1:140-1348(+)